MIKQVNMQLYSQSSPYQMNAAEHIDPRTGLILANMVVLRKKLILPDNVLSSEINEAIRCTVTENGKAEQNKTLQLSLGFRSLRR